MHLKEQPLADITGKAKSVAAALGVKSFGLVCNDPVSELKYSKILAITPDNYKENTLNRDRNGMKNLTVDKVSNFILEKINKNYKLL